MKKISIALAFLFVAFEAQAISRYETSRMSCGEVQATVRAEGEAILRYPSRTNPSIQRYDRYVSNRGFCRLGERTERVYIPTADQRSCLVLICKQIQLEDRVRLRRLVPAY